MPRSNVRRVCLQPSGRASGPRACVLLQAAASLRTCGTSPRLSNLICPTGEGSSEICLRKARVVEDFIESHGVPGLQLVQGIGRHLVESAGLNGSFEFLINHSGSPCVEQARQIEHLLFGELLGEIHDFGGAHLERRNHRMGVMTNIPS